MQRRGLHRLEDRGGNLAHALLGDKLVGRGGEDAGEVAETGDQLLGERLDVAARDGGAEKNFQDLVIMNGGRTAGEKSGAQALAMLEVVGRAGVRRRRHRAGGRARPGRG